jgi:hypothetical protein
MSRTKLQAFVVMVIICVNYFKNRNFSFPIMFFIIKQLSWESLKLKEK